MSGSPLIFPFRFGLNEAIDPKALPPLTLTKAQNCRADKQGRLRKRFGTTALSTSIVGGGSIAAGVRLVPRGDVLGLFDGTNLYEYSDAFSAWTLIDRAPPFEVKWKPLISATSNAVDCTIGMYGNLMVVVYGAGYAAGYPLWVEVRDVTTGAIVMRPQSFGAGASVRYPRILFSGSTALIVGAVSTSIVVIELDMTTLTLGNTMHGLGSVGIASAGIFDAVMVGTEMHVAYEDSGGSLKYGAWDTTSTSYPIVGSTVVVQATTVQCVALDATAGESTYIIYSTSGLTRLAVHNPSTHAQTTAPVTWIASASRKAAVVRYDSTHCLAACDAATTLTTAVFSNVAAVDATTLRKTSYAFILSKFWQLDGRFYIAATNACIVPPDSGAPAPSHVVVECETSNVGSYASVPHRSVAMFEPRTAAINTQTDFDIVGRFYVTQVAMDSSNVLRLAAPLRLLPTSSATERLPTAFDLVEIQKPGKTSDFMRSLKVGASVLTAAGQPSFLDGVSVLPAGFFNEPQFDVVTTMNTVGGSMLAGTYSYRAVYEYIDANGILHRSPASSSRTPTAVTGSTGKITLTVRPTSLSGKQTLATGLSTSGAGPVRIAIYRTEANLSDFYRLTHEPDVNVYVNNPIVNTSITVTDTQADSNVGNGVALSKRPQLYTATGELDEVAPPAAITGVAHRDRAVLLAGDGRTLWLSKKVTENTLVAPAFNEALCIVFAKDKSAVASLDDALVVLGPDSIDFVDGDGTAATGGATGWGVRPVQTDVGCSNPRSVVRGPMGVFFQSERGLELLDRGSTITWIGAAVQDTLSAFPVITSAVLVASQHEVRWTCANTGFSAGVVLVYDYVAQQWFTRTYTDSGTPNAVWIDAKLVGGTYTLLSASGQVYRENLLSCLDYGSVWVARDIEVAWLAPGGNQAWQRVKRMNLMGTSVTDHDLVIQIGRDFATSYEQTEALQSNSDVTSAGPLETVRVAHKNQKAQAVRYRIYDAAPTGPGASVGTGEGSILEGIALLVQPKEGLPRRGATRQAG